MDLFVKYGELSFRRGNSFKEVVQREKKIQDEASKRCEGCPFDFPMCVFGLRHRLYFMHILIAC